MITLDAKTTLIASEELKEFLSPINFDNNELMVSKQGSETYVDFSVEKIPPIEPEELFSSKEKQERTLVFYIKKDKGIEVLVNEKKSSIFFQTDSLDIWSFNRKQKLNFEIPDSDHHFTGHIDFSEFPVKAKDSIIQKMPSHWRITLRFFRNSAQASDEASNSADESSPLLDCRIKITTN